MALFRGTDERIPLLTQLYQTNESQHLTAGEAPSDFVGQIVRLESPFYPLEVIRILERFGESWGKSGLSFLSLSLLVKENLPLIREIMEDTADHIGIRATSLEILAETIEDSTAIRIMARIDPDIKELILSHENFYKVEYLISVDPITQAWRVPLNRFSTFTKQLYGDSETLSETRFHPEDLVVVDPRKREPFLTKLFEDLDRIVHGELSVSRCSVCASPFVVTRKTQLYCSARCRNRETVGRHRAKRRSTESKTQEESKHSVHLV